MIQTNTRSSKINTRTEVIALLEEFTALRDVALDEENTWILAYKLDSFGLFQFLLLVEDRFAFQFAENEFAPSQIGDLATLVSIVHERRKDH